MGLFNKRPKLPSYVGIGLDALLQDPEWAYAISRAGIHPRECEIVLRLAEAEVASGDLPESAQPAILFGQGNMLAIAFPAEREVKVEIRDKGRAELQTIRSGYFQIMFSQSVYNLFAFWGIEDGLQRGTAEGETFGRVMSAFLSGRLKPQQVYGTPQSLAARSVAREPQQITPELMSEARRFMEEWTNIVGQAPDEVFYPALARFGRIGGALQGSELLAIGDPAGLRGILDRPWQTWLAIGEKALNDGDLELTVRVFLFAWAMVEQVGFDSDRIAECGFMEPQDETYRAIAAQALAATEQAPDGWAVVERTVSAPTTKTQLQSGLRNLLEK